MKLFKISESDAASHTLLYRGYSVIRELKFSSLEVIITLSYLESLLSFSNRQNMIFLKTTLISYNSEFPCLLNYIFNEAPKGFAQNEFLSSPALQGLESEILKFSRLITGNTLDSMKRFSQTFNVYITYIENLTPYDIYEGEFPDPVCISVYKRAERAYIVYKHDNSSNKSLPPMNDIRNYCSLFGFIGGYIRKIAETQGIDEIDLADYQVAFEKLKKNSKLVWDFIS